MSKQLGILFGSLLMLILMVGTGTAMAVHAQSPTPPVPAGGQAGPGPSGPHPLGQAELDAAAKALGISADDLSTQLQSGTTLEEIATAQGVDPKAVMQAVQAARPLRLAPTELDAAAKALGMTSADLSAQIDAGKSLADIASAQGVDVQTVRQAIQAARNAQMTTQINEAVTAGKISQDKADWLLEGLSKGYMNGPDGTGFGLGFGPGAPGLHVPDGAQPQPTPSTAP